MTAAATAVHSNGPAAPGGKKLSKAEKNKLRKKQAKENKRQLREIVAKKEEEKGKESGEQDAKTSENDGVILEYVEAPLPKEIKELVEAESRKKDEPGEMGVMEDLIPHGEPMAVDEEPANGALEDLKRAFKRFMGQDEGEAEEGTAQREEAPKEEPKDIFGAEEQEEDADKMSKKKRKQLERMKVAELKRLCARPDVVELWDVNAPDPKLLVHLKGYRNTVPVPRHWSQKRAYLQGKRGIEKPPFKLPEYIEATGITEMRDAYREKEAASKQKQQARNRMRPKMGRIEIEYEIMYDAFFKYQTKPKMTKIGDLYYEGKEFDNRPDNLIPGVISDKLKQALGMEERSPPPWLRHMQRYGPPPSYPDLKIPGLNAPIPPGCFFGYEPGMWGKPPVDEYGRPIYGDVFGEGYREDDYVDVDKMYRWGAFQEVEEEQEEEEEEEQEEEEQEGTKTEAALKDGIRTGVASVATIPPGIHTPGQVDIRKQAPESAAATPLPAGASKQLYTVLEERKTSIGPGLMGTDHTYVMPGKDKRSAALAKLDQIRGEGGTGALDVSIDPSELEGLDEAGIRALYQQRVLEEQARRGAGDLSDMVAARAAQQARKIEAKKKQEEEERFKF